MIPADVTAEEIMRTLRENNGIDKVCVDPWGVSIYVVSIERHFKKYTVEIHESHTSKYVEIMSGLRVVEVI